MPSPNSWLDVVKYPTLFHMLITVRATTRATPRHAVEIPCEVITHSDDTPTLAWATDMSANGLWIDDRDDLALGQDLIVCFKPGLRWRAHELMVFANVSRTSPGLRTDDPNPGCGVSFVDLSPGERFGLRAWLRPRPERAPSRRRRTRESAPAQFRWPAPAQTFAASPFARRVD
jgi:hypothetical protein